MQNREDLVGGLRIFSRAWIGSTPGRTPLVLVHGLGVSSRYMVPIARRMAPRMPVYAPDLPGFGRSQHPPEVFNIPDLAAALCDWMDALEIEQASLLGNSLGCQVAARFALRYPERVNRLVLTGPTIDPRFRSYWKIISRAGAALLFEPQRLYPILLTDYLAAGSREMMKVLGFALDDPVEAYLPQIEQPVMIVRGEKDWIASQAWVEQMAALLPNARLEVIRGGAHALNYDSADALERLLRDFLITTLA